MEPLWYHIAPMRVLALDVGSSSVKAAVLAGGRLVSPIVRRPVRTDYDPPRVEIPAEPLWRSTALAIRDLAAHLRGIDRIALDAMCPSCVLLDRRGTPLTPLITHQDRRSIAEAKRIEEAFGPEGHLALAGNRPFPGGIASTTLLWMRGNAGGLLRRAATIGMATTFLIHRLTGERAIDPGNAAFLGLYDFRRRAAGGPPAWSAELRGPSGVREEQLPEILDGGEPAGRVLPGPARALGLPPGVEVTAGVVDTSASFLGAGAEPGRLINSIGTTDVIALCRTRPNPHPRLLTRELGSGPYWLSVHTIAAGGGSVEWAHRALFPDLTAPAFYRLARRLAGQDPAGKLRFRPYLAGDRMSIDQVEAGFDGVDLRTTREDLLRAILAALARWNGEGMTILTKGARPLPDVYVAGGGGWLGTLLHRAWRGTWRFRPLEDASLRGLARLAAGKAIRAAGRRTVDRSGNPAVAGRNGS
jgi:xylulokinase